MGKADWAALQPRRHGLACMHFRVSPALYPTQVGKADWASVQQGPPWAVDAWGLGCLMQEAYAGRPLARIEDLRSVDAIPKSVLPVQSPIPAVPYQHMPGQSGLLLRILVCGHALRLLDLLTFLG